MSNLPRLGANVNPQQQNDNQTGSGPSRPEIDRPINDKASFTMVPTRHLLRLVREKEIKREHIPAMTAIADRCFLQPSGQWTLSFPSEKTIAAECGCDEKTVQRAVKSMRETGLATIYPARMTDGKYARNVYDCTPWFRLCGVEAREHNMDTVRQHLNKEGRWVRGLERLDADGNVVQWADFDKNRRGGATPVSQSNSAGDTGLYSETPPQEPGTGGHGCRPNLTEFADEFVNKNKSNPRPRLKSLGDDLTGAEQVVFVALKDLRYGAYKAVCDLKKFGANYVQRLIDYVKCQKDVQSVPRLLNKLMGRDIDELYRPKNSGKLAPALAPRQIPPPVPRPAAPPIPQPAAPPIPQPAAPPIPQPAAPPETSLLAHAAERRAEVFKHTQAQILRALSNLRSDSQPSAAKYFKIEEAESVTALVQSMKVQHLAVLLGELSVIKNADKAREEMEGREENGSFSDEGFPFEDDDEDFF